MITTEVISDIQNCLSQHFIKNEIQSIKNFEKILGGADTTIYSFKIIGKSENVDLILRIYREGVPNYVAEIEFFALENLYKSGLNVPKPFGILKEDSSIKRACLIMEKIDGILLGDAMMKPGANLEELFLKMMKNLVKLHELDWNIDNENVNPPDISSDPYILIKNNLINPLNLVKKYKISELKPLVSWVQKTMKKYPCEELVLLHGDYHPMNMILVDDTLTTIDWSNITLGDRRQDLAFLIVVMSSFISKDDIIDIYQEIWGKKINGVDYFMVLSSIHNLFRIYSMLVNYEITNENDDTKHALIEMHRSYTDNVIKTVKFITGLSFPKIESKLKDLQ